MPLAYIDDDVLVSAATANSIARYLMQPSPFAKLAQLANVQPDDAVLDIGCGTGYSSAVISRIARSVIAVESDTESGGSGGRYIVASRVG